jgi:outer membrane receptor protein involved in Fe transport
LAYENRKLVIRLAANFNGEYLSEVGGNASEDLYIKSRMQLDMNASYAFSQRFRLFAEALNLTNQPFESFYGSKAVMAQREFYRWWMRLGVKFDLGNNK